MSCIDGSEEQNITTFGMFTLFNDNNNLCSYVSFFMSGSTSCSTLATCSRTFQQIGQFAIAMLGLIVQQNSYNHSSLHLMAAQ